MLLLGESGTGKELFARAIHAASHRRNGPFRTVNCGAIPAGLLESELFGHKKGAFTGAMLDRRGAFEEAHGGTLFLDEVGECEPAMPIKLLRVLQSPPGKGPCCRVFSRLGENNLADLVGVSRNTVGNYELGRTDSSTGDLVRIAGALGCTLHELLAVQEDSDLCDEVLGNLAARKDFILPPRQPQTWETLKTYTFP